MQPADASYPPWIWDAQCSHRHHDLVQQPQLIRTQHEDFRNWTQHPAIETFYRLLEWLNGPASILETNDCAFTGPGPNQTAGFPQPRQCSGRVMLLFRDLSTNTRAAKVHAHTQTVAHGVSMEAQAYQEGVIGAAIVPVRFTTLPGPEAAQLGSQLMQSFWAWGDDPPDTMAHLDRILITLSTVLRHTAAGSKG